MGLDPTVLQAASVATSVFGLLNSQDQADQAAAAAAQQRDALAALQQKPEPTMPTATDSDVRRARRASIVDQMRRRGGRASTILTGDSANSDVLGA